MEQGAAGDFPDSEWVLLDRLIQRLVVCRQDLAADSFQDEALQQLVAIVPDPAVRDRDGIMTMADEAM